MNFRKTFEEGGGIISNPKNFVAVFSVILGGKNDEFSGKGGVYSNPKKFVADFSTSRKKVQHSFPKRGRGGHRPFGSFPKIHPKLSIESSLRNP